MQQNEEQFKPKGTCTKGRDRGESQCAEVNSHLEKEEQSRRKTHRFQNSYETVWYCHKDRHTDLWNRTECPELDTHICGQMSVRKPRLLNGGEIILTAGVRTITYPHATE